MYTRFLLIVSVSIYAADKDPGRKRLQRSYENDMTVERDVKRFGSTDTMNALQKNILHDDEQLASLSAITSELETSRSEMYAGMMSRIASRGSLSKGLLNQLFLQMIRDDEPDFVRFLIREGADIGVKTAEGDMALHVACSEGNREMISCLLEEGADIQARDALENTALHIACRHGWRKIVQLLLEKGAGKNARNKGHYTPLHLACFGGDVSTVACLLEHKSKRKVKINRRARNGDTPLYIAFVRGHLKVAGYLVKQGADKKIRNHSEETLLQEACGSCSLASVRYLIEKLNFEIDAQAISNARLRPHTFAYLLQQKFTGQCSCVICFEEIKQHAQTTACCFGETYCSECIRRASELKDTCPTCRSSDLKNNLVDVEEVIASSPASSSISECCECDQHPPYYYFIRE